MTNAERKLEVKERVQTAARKVFQEKGYAETKIIDIAQAAAVSPSTIYLYFSGKKALFDSLCLAQSASKSIESQRRHSEICRIALRLFGQNGFERTTMDAIAEETGLSKAALYQYCSNKEDLFLQTLQYYVSTGIQSPDDTRSDDDDWQEYLHRAAKNGLAGVRQPERKAFLTAVIRDSNEFPRFGAAYYELIYQATRKNMVRFLTVQQNKGLIRSDVNIRDCMDVFLGCLMSYIVTYSTIGGIQCDVDEDTYVEQITDIFIRALKPEARG